MNKLKAWLEDREFLFLTDENFEKYIKLLKRWKNEKESADVHEG